METWAAPYWQTLVSLLLLFFATQGAMWRTIIHLLG
jgi:hypothetical protein